MTLRATEHRTSHSIAIMSPQLKTTDASTSSRRHDAARPQQSTRVVYCEVFQSNHVAAAAARSLHRMIFPATEATPMYPKTLSPRSEKAQRARGSCRPRSLRYASIAPAAATPVSSSLDHTAPYMPHPPHVSSSFKDNDGRFDGQR